MASLWTYHASRSRKRSSSGITLSMKSLALAGRSRTASSRKYMLESGRALKFQSSSQSLAPSSLCSAWARFSKWSNALGRRLCASSKAGDGTSSPNGLASKHRQRLSFSRRTPSHTTRVKDPSLYSSAGGLWDESSNPRRPVAGSATAMHSIPSFANMSLEVIISFSFNALCLYVLCSLAFGACLMPIPLCSVPHGCTMCFFVVTYKY